MPVVHNLSPDELLTTTRAVRKRLDFDRPVPDDVIHECLAVAQQAPTASNRQNWHFMVVTDADKRMALAELYRKGWQQYTPNRPRPQLISNTKTRFAPPSRSASEILRSISPTICTGPRRWSSPASWAVPTTRRHWLKVPSGAPSCPLHGA